MSTPVVMPQMGESIAEGTVVRWIKKVGDTVDRDEPLFEISTDKVDAEIPSPVAGTLLEITVGEGQTVAVNSVVATIGQGGAAGVPRAVSEAPEAPPDASRAPRVQQTASDASGPVPMGRGGEAGGHGTAPQRSPRSSPLVRRIAKEHNVEISRIPGSGIGGRVTKTDILGYIEKGPAVARASAATLPAYAPGERVYIEPMSVMRRKIAEHMVLSKQTSAHVYTVFEVNYSHVDKIRQARKADYERSGVKLTFTAFIAKVVVDCLRHHPVINASIDGSNVVYKKDVNVGVAVALDNGLIVPVVKGADEKNLLGLARAIADVADRARNRKLSPDEVHGGTFTITNPGTFGAQFGLPIINQPQVAILGVGAIEKRPVVIDDLIGIRLMGFLTLGYDHRLVDGVVADRFMADVQDGIESFDPEQV